ncbi:MAG: DUF4328 domain-containing protein [Acidobacteria bacterium]|nr:DUF4328 domain-containing protein [Acidobacteriota bacterium]
MSTPSLTPFASAHARAQLTKALLLANAAIAVLSVAVTLLAGDPAAGDAAALEEELKPAELVAVLVGLLQFTLYVATAVAFLLWLHRAYKNLYAFGARTEQSPGWAVGMWFIPFANLVRPYQAVKEMWVKSDPAADFSQGYADRGLSARPATLVGVWWGAWLISNFFDRFYGRIVWDAETPEQLSTAATLGVASSLLTVVAAALAFLVVKTIDRMQTEKAAQLRVSAWPEPPPPPASFDNPPAPA